MNKVIEYHVKKKEGALLMMFMIDLSNIIYNTSTNVPKIFDLAFLNVFFHSLSCHLTIRGQSRVV